MLRMNSLGDSVEGKDVVVIDDMISSGGSMLDVAKQLKERNAKRVFVCTTYGLFTDGLDKFDEYYEKGWLDRVITTNLNLPHSGTSRKTILCRSKYEQISCEHH